MPPKVVHNALQPGLAIQRYRIERPLARGSFGITYRAEDCSLNRPVVIKEYFPLELAVRDTDATIQPVSSDDASAYQLGLQRFVAEARVLAKFNHRNIVRILEVFEANNTAYIVMNYEEGEPLKDLLARRKTLPESELLTLLFPILDGLEQIHAKGFLHRDIKPANVLIRPDGTPLLLDFGSARQALSQQTGTFTTLYSPGFAPIEQYAGPAAEQGPWTDIYGLGATLYCAITGQAPVEALQRSHGILQQQRDPYRPIRELASSDYRQTFLRAIDRALAFKVGDRPQTIAAWRREFDAAEVLPGRTEAETLSLKIEPDYRPTAARKPKPEARPAGQQESGRRRVAGLTAISIAIGAGLGFGLFHLLRNPVGRPPAVQPRAALAPSPAVMAGTPSPAPPAADTADEYAAILAHAEEDILAGRLISPEGNNALALYRKVLSDRPNHPRATDALQRLRELMESSARDAASRGADEEALALIAKLKEFGDLGAPLRDVETNINAKRQQAVQALEAQQKQAQRQRYLDEARASLAQGQYQKAAGLLDQAAGLGDAVDSTLSGLRQELEKRRTFAQFIQQGRSALAQGKLDETQLALEQAAKIYPKSRSVLTLRKELEQKRGPIPAEPTDSVASADAAATPQDAAVQKLIDNAIQAMNRSDWGKARAALEKAGALAPDSPDVQLLNGELEARQKAALPNDGIVVPVRKSASHTQQAPVAEPAAPVAPAPAVADPATAVAETSADQGVVVSLSRNAKGRNAPIAAPAESAKGETPADPGSVAAVPKPGAANQTVATDVPGIKINAASTSVTTARPGDTIEFHTRFDLTLPPETKFEYVEVTWTLKRNGRTLGERGEYSGSAKAGSNEASTELALPNYMKPGKFTVEHRINSAVGQAVAVSHFTVTAK